MRKARVASPQSTGAFDGAFKSTMGEAEAFFNKKSPFQEAAEEKVAPDRYRSPSVRSCTTLSSWLRIHGTL